MTELIIAGVIILLIGGLVALAVRHAESGAKDKLNAKIQSARAKINSIMAKRSQPVPKEDPMPALIRRARARRDARDRRRNR